MPPTKRSQTREEPDWASSTSRSLRRAHRWNPGCEVRCAIPDEELEYEEGEWFEVCPHCGGEAEGCMTCWDEGVVPHFCREGVE
jgi:hypothetical protein